jgi:hypothetical protein
MSGDPRLPKSFALQQQGPLSDAKTTMVLSAAQRGEAVRVSQGRPFELSAILGSLTFQIAALR